MLDKLRSNKSSLIILEAKQIILKTVRKDRNNRKKFSARIKYEHELNSIIILKVLKRNNIRSYKIIKKFYLTEIMRKARL